MASHQRSEFRPYAMGVATENNIPGSRMLEITLSEIFPAQTGESTSRYDAHDVTGTDAAGQAYAGKSKTSNSITAEWVPFGSNRITAPNVRRNEPVLVWATADHSEYRWVPLGDADDYRNTEIVVWGFRAAKDYNNPPTQQDSMYVFEVNTERGLVAFSTTTDRGEYTRTAMVWDLAQGEWTYEDGTENKIHSDAKESKIIISNKYECEVCIKEDRVWLKSPTMVTLDTPYTQLAGHLNVMGGVTASGYGVPPNGWISYR